MKSLFKGCGLFAAMLLAATLNTVKSQDLKKELDVMIKKFEASYNKQDDKALKALYTENATRTDPDGSVINGSEGIRQQFVDSWANAKLILSIKHDKAEKQADGSIISTGTYHVDGRATSGDPISVDGAFTNTLVKENGKWKISKSVLSSL
jgi:ketosteroid isomerase-like protein